MYLAPLLALLYALRPVSIPRPSDYPVFKICVVLLAILLIARLDVHALGLYAAATRAPAKLAVSDDGDAAITNMWRPAALVRLSPFLLYYESCKDKLALDDCHDNFIATDPDKNDVITLSEYVKSGTSLLAMAGGAEKIRNLVVLDFINPFDTMLGVRPATALPLWFDAITLSASCRPAAPALFSHADYVMQPLYPVLPLYVRDLEAYYGEYLKANYAELAHNRHFILWKRVKPAAIDISHYDCVPS